MILLLLCCFHFPSLFSFLPSPVASLYTASPLRHTEKSNSRAASEGHAISFAVTFGFFIRILLLFSFMFLRLSYSPLESSLCSSALIFLRPSLCSISPPAPRSSVATELLSRHIIIWLTSLVAPLWYLSLIFLPKVPSPFLISSRSFSFLLNKQISFKDSGCLKKRYYVFLPSFVSFALCSIRLSLFLVVVVVKKSGQQLMMMGRRWRRRWWWWVWLGLVMGQWECIFCHSYSFVAAVHSLCF